MAGAGSALVEVSQRACQGAGNTRRQRTGSDGRNHEATDQQVCGSYVISHGCIIRPFGYIEFRRDQLMGQSDQAVATCRSIEDGLEFKVSVGNRAKS